MLASCLCCLCPWGEQADRPWELPVLGSLLLLRAAAPLVGTCLIPTRDRGRGVSPGFLGGSFDGARPGPGSVPVLGVASFVQVLHNQSRHRSIVCQFSGNLPGSLRIQVVLLACVEMGDQGDQEVFCFCEEILLTLLFVEVSRRFDVKVGITFFSHLLLVEKFGC